MIDYSQYQQGLSNPLATALQGYQAGAGLRQQQLQQQQLQQQQQQAQQMQLDLAALASKKDASSDDYLRMMTKYPQMAEHFKKSYDILDAEQQKTKQKQALGMYSAISSGQTDIAKQQLKDQMEAAKNSGNKQDYDAANALMHLVDTNPEAAKTSSGLFLVSTLGADKLAAALKTTMPAAAGSEQVQASSILPDGTTIEVMKTGGTRVIGADGEELKGKDRISAIKSAAEFGIDIQKQRAQGRKIGEFSAKMVEQITTQANKLRGNNDNLRQVIAEVRNGAKSGVLLSRLPSFRAESIRLDNLRNKLGLDVIGSVTFGALSEGELKLAMDTALPKNLSGPDLAKWAEDRINAQEKLASYLEEQAAFLSQPGNTPAGWTAKIKSAKRATQQAATTTAEPGTPQTTPIQKPGEAAPAAAADPYARFMKY